MVIKSYLGQRADAAENELASDGYHVTCIEVRSKKGVPVGENRVIRQRITGSNTVELVFSRFMTAVSGDEE